MQIREMNLKELDLIYGVLSQLRDELSFKEFDDLVYEMRHMEYKMIGLLERGELISYAGVAVQTNFYHKRHLYVFDLVTDEKYRGKGYGKEMLTYLEDYAKTAMCENIVLSSGFSRDMAHKFYEKNGFMKKSYVFLKGVV
ncbi:GNAT family N-acetyltransferase [Sulfurimonas aquatica]|uniref:GNAT family N-acetyltransferase n=1 Tax=Sulfurimonas aquatica TaxID=2672570 RepID=A0A975AZ00_9BACT|nr:GNAT family N-acetyltransferase [Sulfurimonas aquatica]QSZ41179.1 GNAT family N-acetyltransferase [Sulfurimonas aquatica]